MTDPFADVASLPGVADAVSSARAAVDRLLGHRVLRRRSAEVSAESALRGARASAALEGRSVELEDVRSGAIDDPVVQGALRVSAEVGALSEVWRQAPRQVLARLHTLAALDVVAPDHLGRPRTDAFTPAFNPAAPEAVREASGGPGAVRGASGGPGAVRGASGGPGAVRGVRGEAEVSGPAGLGSAEPHGRRAEPVSYEGAHEPVPLGTATGLVELGPPPGPAEVSARLDALIGLLTGPTEAPALVVGAIVHGELLALRPFGWGDGVVARAAQRVTFIERGLDPKSLVAAEVGHTELASAYAEALRGYVSGTAAGVAGWVRHCADAVSAAARDSLAVCEALQRG